MPIGLSLVQHAIIDDIKVNGIPRSQASLARRIGRSRATVHSAVKVLRRRGIMRKTVSKCSSSNRCRRFAIRELSITSGPMSDVDSIITSQETFVAHCSKPLGNRLVPCSTCGWMKFPFLRVKTTERN